jgi:HEPN domain-containing protein
MVDKKALLAKEWFKKAAADIDFAELGYKDTEHYGQVCFLCQQASEKYLKGFLVAKGVKPKRIHSLAALALKCSEYVEAFKSFMPKLKILDRYYIPARYPVMISLKFKKQDATEALRILHDIVDLVVKNV